jgi:hypothetical protein
MASPQELTGPVRARSYGALEEALAAAGLERLPAADAVQQDRS